MTDPQDDKPCRDCKRPTQHATERCDDCRTPAGRLVTALRERGIKSEASDDTDGVIVDGLFVDAVDCGWGISGNGDDLDGNIEAAANAIAAIVRAPGLRAERDTLAAEVKRLREELEKPAAPPAANAWTPILTGWARYGAGMSEILAIVNGAGWEARAGGQVVAQGPETGDAGRHAADLALLAAGYRLVGGVHPLPVAAECRHRWKSLGMGGGDSDDGRSDLVCALCGAEPDDVREVPDAP